MFYIILYQKWFPRELSSFNNEQLKELMSQWNISHSDNTTQEMIKIINKHIRIYRKKLERSCLFHNNDKYYIETQLTYKSIQMGNYDDIDIYFISRYDYEDIKISHDKKGGFYEIHNNRNYESVNDDVILEIKKYINILKYLDMRILMYFFI